MFSLTFLAVVDWFCTVLSNSGLHLAVRQSLRKLWVMTENVPIITFSSLKNAPLHLPNPQSKLAFVDPWGVINLVPQIVRGKLALSEQLITELSRIAWEPRLCLSCKSYIGTCLPLGTTRGISGHAMLPPVNKIWFESFLVRSDHQLRIGNTLLHTAPMATCTCYSFLFTSLHFSLLPEFASSITLSGMPWSCNCSVSPPTPAKYWRLH